MALPIWAIPICEALIERLIERLVHGKTDVETISLKELIDEKNRNALIRAASLEAAKRRLKDNSSNVP